MKTRIGLGVCIFALLGVLAIGEPAWGQTGFDSRKGEGSVRRGGPGAQVTTTLAGTDTWRLADKDNGGLDHSWRLPVGHYEVTVDAAGFKKFVVKDLVVDIGHVANMTATLQVGGSEQTVTVEANPPRLKLRIRRLGGVMNASRSRELPLSTRNTYQLLQFQPGVQSQLGADLFYGSD